MKKTPILLALALLVATSAQAQNLVYPGNPWGGQAQVPTYPNNPLNVLPNNSRFLAPAEFDHPYPADKFFHITAPADEMAALCPNVKTAFRVTLGCTYPPRALGNLPERLKELRGDADCVIVSPDADLLRATGWDAYGDEIFRHEQAHCWGWPASHPGVRPLVGNRPNRWYY